MSTGIQTLLLSDFGEFLDWNRYMLIGFSLWALLVAFVVATATDNQCTADNPFAGMVWIVGLILLLFTVLAELVTDISELRSSTKKKEKSMFSKHSHDITWISVAWRFISNSTLFYVLIAIGSYNWFPVGAAEAGCFIPWTPDAKNKSLIVTGSVAFFFLLLRMMLFNYETLSQDARVAEILTKLVKEDSVSEFDFGKDIAKIEKIITNFGNFAKRLKRRKAYFDVRTGVFLDDQADANGASFPANILEEPDYAATDRATIELTLQKMKLLSRTLTWLDTTLDEFVSNPVPITPENAGHPDHRLH